VDSLRIIGDMTSMQDPKHPIWSILRLVVLMVAMCVTLWSNASNFDVTELRSIITMFFVAASSEAVVGVLTKRKKEE